MPRAHGGLLLIRGAEMKLNPDALQVVSFQTDAVQSQHANTFVPNETSTPTAATMCEFCASDSGCW